MTFNQLKYVVAVAKTGSINKAAADLFISLNPWYPPLLRDWKRRSGTTFSCAATAVLR